MEMFMEITVLNMLTLIYLILAIYTAGLTAGRLKIHNEVKLNMFSFIPNNIEIILVSLVCGILAPIIYIWSSIEWLVKEK